MVTQIALTFAGPSFLFVVFLLELARPACKPKSARGEEAQRTQRVTLASLILGRFHNLSMFLLRDRAMVWLYSIA